MLTDAFNKFTKLVQEKKVIVTPESVSPRKDVKKFSSEAIVSTKRVAKPSHKMLQKISADVISEEESKHSSLIILLKRGSLNNALVVRKR